MSEMWWNGFIVGLTQWDEVLAPLGLWVLEGVVVASLVGREVRRPPLSVRGACWIELFFGVGLAVNAWLLTDAVARGYVIGISATGLLWCVPAVAILLGKRWARGMLLVLSVIRAATVVGVGFSAGTIYLLYARRAAREYFAKPEPGVDTVRSPS